MATIVTSPRTIQDSRQPSTEILIPATGATMTPPAEMPIVPIAMARPRILTNHFAIRVGPTSWLPIALVARLYKIPYVKKNTQMFCTKYTLASMSPHKRLPAVTITLAPCFLSSNVPRNGSNGKLTNLKIGISENCVREMCNSSPIGMIKNPNA